MSYFLKHYNEPGSPPGELAAPAPAQAARVRLVRYNAQHYEVEDDVAPERLAACRTLGDKLWLNIAGRPDVEWLRRLGEALDLHALALEDVIHAGQRAKVEDYEHHLFVVLRRPRWVGRRLAIGQVSLFLGEGYVISIDDNGGDSFEPVQRRIATSPGGRIRSNGIDYLFYALVDLVVDQGFPILEGYAEELEELELAVMEDPRAEDLMDRIHESRRELVFLRRALWSQREATAELMRSDHPMISPATRIYLRDAADHAGHLVDLAESYRDMSAAVLELLMSSLNKQTNEVMRVLTMIATIFIPLSFVVGLYGMNFNTEISPWNMPELNWRYGYPAVLLGMAGGVAGMVVYFKRRGWF